MNTLEVHRVRVQPPPNPLVATQAWHLPLGDRRDEGPGIWDGRALSIYLSICLSIYLYIHTYIHTYLYITI